MKMKIKNVAHVCKHRNRGIMNIYIFEKIVNEQDCDIQYHSSQHVIFRFFFFIRGSEF